MVLLNKFGMIIEYQGGQTPLDPEELEALKVAFISTQAELNQWEQYNIEKALVWSSRKSWSSKQLITISFSKRLHQKMFDEVWDWAGQYRTSNKNIGVDKHQIPLQLEDLCRDTLYWLEHQTFSIAEIAIRFKHRLVSIHPFVNGNGRHSRIMADLIYQTLTPHSFSWGKYYEDPDIRRARYLKAIRAADLQDYTPLLTFAQH